MSYADDLARAISVGAMDAASEEAQFRTVKVTEATDLAVSGPLSVTAPGRSEAISSVGAVMGSRPSGMLTGQQALILDGPTPQRIGRSPWQTSNLT